jgi:CheY-like chemotaxis protein
VTSILVVEDEMMIALALEKMLDDLGFQQVALAMSLDQALEAAALGPDCAIVDYKLGIETAEPLLRVLEARAIPFILVTGYDDRALSAMAGAGWPILTKPTLPAALCEALGGLGIRAV